MNLKEAFSKCEDEYGRFENVINKLTNRPDLHAFILLDRLTPEDTNKNIISACIRDEFYLEVDLEKLEQIISESEVVDLVRCGVRYDSQYDCLCMFA